MLLTLFLALSMGLTTSATSSQTGNTIAGVITDTSRRPVVDLYVELLNDVEVFMQRVKTDNSGRYVFSRVPRGDFHIRIVTAGTNFVSPPPTRVEVIVVSSQPGAGRAYEERNFVLQTVDEVKGGIKTPAARTVFSQNVPAEAQKLYDSAMEKLNSGNTDGTAIGDLQKAIELFPNYYQAMERLGAEYVKQGKYSPAQEVLAKAVKVNPKGQMSLHALGVAQYNLKDLSGATDSLQRAVLLAPNSANSQMWLGIVLFRNGKLVEAEGPLKKAYEIGGKQLPADLHMYLAQIYSNTKRYKEAADELELFLQEAPDATDATKIRGIIETLRTKAKQP